VVRRGKALVERFIRWVGNGGNGSDCAVLAQSTAQCQSKGKGWGLTAAHCMLVVHRSKSFID
jgi:hypothetical protein